MRRFTTEERAEYVAQYNNSGLSVSEFARQNQLNIKTFGNWKRAVDKSSTRPMPITKATKRSRRITTPSKLHPLNVTDTDLRSSTTTINFPNGVSVQLPNATTSHIIQLVNSYPQCSH